MSLDHLNGREPTFVSDSEEYSPVSPPQGGETERGGATTTRDARGARDVSQSEESLSSMQEPARDATRDAPLEEPCNVDPRRGPGHHGWCLAWHDTGDHRYRIEQFLREHWQVMDAQELWEEYPWQVVLAAAWEFLRRKPETPKSPSGFFISRLRKLDERYRQGGDMLDWARHYM